MWIGFCFTTHNNEIITVTKQQRVLTAVAEIRWALVVSVPQADANWVRITNWCWFKQQLNFASLIVLLFKLKQQNGWSKAHPIFACLVGGWSNAETNELPSMRYFSYLQQMHLIGLFALSTSLFDGRKPAQATRCLNAHLVSLVQPVKQWTGRRGPMCLLARGNRRQP